MAKLVKEATGENEAARIALHGIVSAALAEVQGGNGLAAAAGGMASAALMGNTLAKAFYGKDVKDLDGEQRAFISNLATAVGAAAGGSVGGDTFSAASGANAARVEVENNALSLPKGMNDIGLSQQSLAASMMQNGATPDELTEALIKNSQGQIPEGQDAVKGLLTAWAEFFGVPVSALTANGEMTPQRAAEIVASGVPTSEAKLIQYVAAKAFLAVTKTTVKNETGNSLTYHENFGGHVIEKHVGKSDAELIFRLKEEPRLSASSSFYDAQVADRAIGNGIAANKDQLANWLAGDQQRLVLTHEEKFSVGNVIQKGNDVSHASKTITIVTDKDPLMPNGYRVHTAYPK